MLATGIEGDRKVAMSSELLFKHRGGEGGEVGLVIEGSSECLG